VIGHCFTCSRHTRILKQISQELTRAGFWALRFDFSGNGQSEGEFEASSYSKHIGEMKTAAGFIAQQGVDWIGLAGHSMGAAIAVLTAGQTPTIKAVCSIAGRLSSTNALHFLNPANIEELGKTGCVTFSSRGRSLKLCDDFFSDADRHDLPVNVKKIASRLLIVHGDHDEIVPVNEVDLARGLDPSAIEIERIPGADHMFSDSTTRAEVSRLVADWFAKRADG
jgi:putative redox protein